MSRTVVLSAARTPFGKLGGGLSSVDATELGGAAARPGSGHPGPLGIEVVALAQAGEDPTHAAVVVSDSLILEHPDHDRVGVGGGRCVRSGCHSHRNRLAACREP